MTKGNEEARAFDAGRPFGTRGGGRCQITSRNSDELCGTIDGNGPYYWCAKTGEHISAYAPLRDFDLVNIPDPPAASGETDAAFVERQAKRPGIGIKSHERLISIARTARVALATARADTWKRAIEVRALVAGCRRMAEVERELEDERTYALRLQITLTGLAGGGSENFVRHGDGFRADIDFCRNQVIRRTNDSMEFGKEQTRRARAAESTIASLREQVNKMRSAMEPFAQEADWWELFDDGHRITDCGDAHHFPPGQRRKTTVGHLRAAARALAETEPREGGR